MASTSEQQSATNSQVTATTVNITTSALRKFLALVVDPSLHGLSRASQRILQVVDNIQETQEGCLVLASKTEQLTTDVLKYATAAPLVPHSRETARPLERVLNDIAVFLEEQSAKSVIDRVVHQSDIRSKIRILDERLDTAVAEFQHSLMSSIASLQFQVQKSRISIRETVYGAQLNMPSELPIMTLPPKPAIFYGRNVIVESIVSTLVASHSARLAILGTGGMGKTTIATTVLHDDRVKTKFRGVRIFISCDGIASAEGIVTVLATALKLLDQHDLRQAVLRYLTLRRAPILLCLDNLESAWDTIDQAAVEDLLTQLGNLPDLSLVITMRGLTRPLGVCWTYPPLAPLEPLDLADGRRIFLDIARKVDSRLDDLLSLLGGLPLAITLMAFQGQLLAPAELISAYEREHTALIGRGRRRRLTSLEVSIQVSLNSLTMQEHPQAEVLLSHLALLPDGVEPGELRDMLPSMDSSAEAARILLQVALVTNTTGRLKVLSPIRTYITDLYPGVSHLQDLRRYFFSIASRATSLGTHEEPVIAQLTRQFGNIHAVLSQALQASATTIPILTAVRNIGYFSQFAHYGDCAALLEAGFNTGRITPALAAISAEIGQVIGSVFIWQSRFEEATEMLEKARSMFTTAGVRLGVAQCSQGLANILLLEGCIDDALLSAKESREEFGAIGSVFGKAQCSLSIGNILYSQDKYEEAKTELERAKQLFEREGSQIGQAQCLQGIGDVLQGERHYEEAISTFTQAKNAFAEVGSRLGASQCLQRLGFVKCLQGDFDKAFSILEEARTSFKEIERPYGVAECLAKQGEISCIWGKYADAKSQLGQAKDIFEVVGDELAAAACVQGQGTQMYLQDRYNEAETFFFTAKRVFETSKSSKSQLSLAQCCQSLGNILYMRDQTEDATSLHLSAATIFESVGRLTSAAQSVQFVADIQFSQGNFDVASPGFKKAKALYDSDYNRLGTAHCLQRLGDILQSQWSYKEALDSFLLASAAFKEDKDQLGAAQTDQRLAELLYMFRGRPEAECVLQRAKECFHGLGDERGVAQCMLSLGNILVTEDQYDEATPVLQKARDAFESCGDRFGVAQSQQLLGRAYVETGQREEGISALREAMEMYKGIKGSFWEVNDCMVRLHKLGLST